MADVEIALKSTSLSRENSSSFVTDISFTRNDSSFTANIGGGPSDSGIGRGLSILDGKDKTPTRKSLYNIEDNYISAKYKASGFGGMAGAGSSGFGNQSLLSEKDQSFSNIGMKKTDSNDSISNENRNNNISKSRDRTPAGSKYSHLQLTPSNHNGGTYSRINENQ